MSSHKDDRSDLSSESEQEEVYEVDRILAQKEFEDGQERFLVRWVGYPDERSTWEPTNSFLNPQTLISWAHDLLTGNVPSVAEVEEIQARIDAFEKAKAVRQQRRRQVQRRRSSRLDSCSHRPESEDTGSRTISTFLRTSVSPDAKTDINPVPSKQPHLPKEKSARYGHDAAQRPVLSKMVVTRPRIFHGVGGVNKAHRSGYPQMSSSRGIPGKHFPNLSNARRKQLAGRNEPAPDRNALKLISLDELAAKTSADTAHILPPGTPRSQQVRFQDTASTQSVPTPDSTWVKDGEGLSRNRPFSSTHAQRSMHTFHVPKSTVFTLASQDDLKLVRTHKGIERKIHWSDLLVECSFGGVGIGDVRIVGLDKFSKRPLLNIKVGHTVSIVFNPSDSVTHPQYEDLCRGVASNSPMQDNELINCCRDLIISWPMGPFTDLQTRNNPYKNLGTI